MHACVYVSFFNAVSLYQVSKGSATQHNNSFEIYKNKVVM